MGSGHVMRCLTLADELNAQGAEVSFITCGSAGPLLDTIGAKGHGLHVLSDLTPGADNESGLGTNYAHWLPVSWQSDAEQTLEVLGRSGGADWLVVDHYALDARWERRIRARAAKIMVIDDLSDRPHVGVVIAEI